MIYLIYLELRTHSALQYLDSGCTSYFTEICKISNYGRNARGLTVYVRDDISKRVTEISANMKDILWIRSGRKIAHI
jgi:hypothetical protein